MICLAAGAVLDAALVPYSGKGNSELGLFRRLAAAFSANDVILGRRDHLVCWRKPAARPHWMTPEQYAAFPAELKVRETKVAH